MSDAPKTRVTLHYGGETYQINESHKNILKEVDDTTGAINIQLETGHWLRFVLGPGIPVLIEEKPVAPVRVRRATVG